MNDNEYWESEKQETASMKTSVGLSTLSTTVDEFMWMSVDKRGVSIQGVCAVDKHNCSSSNMHLLSTDLVSSLVVGNRSFKKKVDRLSTYPQCLLIGLFNKINIYSIRI